jgi:hypothetical protein
MIKDFEIEKPNKAAAVIITLIAVTSPAPSLLVILSDNRLDIMVHPAISIVNIPAYDIGTPSSPYIIGHADPSKESGSPRLINEMYMIASNKEYMYSLLMLYSSIFTLIYGFIYAEFDALKKH